MSEQKFVRWVLGVTGGGFIFVAIIHALVSTKGVTGVGPLRILIILTGLGLIGIGWSFPHGRDKGINLLLNRCTIILTQIVIFINGLIGIELYARSIQGYALWELNLQLASNFSSGDIRRIFNQRYYENNYQFFNNWPVPIELFDPLKEFGSASERPPYLFKPNTRFAYKNGGFVPAQPGDSIFWSANSLGFRGTEFLIDKRPDVVRIVCLGGSTTEGSQSDSETYPIYLQQELTNQFPNKKFEVINAGYSGQNSHDLLLILTHRILSLHPDIVIYYEVGNGINEWEPLEGKQTPDTWKFFLMRNLDEYSAFYRLIAEKNGWAFPPSTYTYNTSKVTPSLQNYLNGVQQIIEVTRQNGIKLLIVSPVNGYSFSSWSIDYIPQNIYWIYRRWYPIRPDDIDRWYKLTGNTFKSLAYENQIAFADLVQDFPKSPSLYATHDIKHFDPSHYSPEGNLLLAKLISQHLTKYFPLIFTTQ